MAYKELSMEFYSQSLVTTLVDKKLSELRAFLVRLVVKKNRV